MRHRVLATLLVGLVPVLLAPVPARCQTTWTPPLTPWGDPDLQGR